MDTLMKIRNKDPSIYEKEKKFFEESDFEDDDQLAKKKKKGSGKEYTYKDMIREVVKGKIDKDSEASGDDISESDDTTLKKRKIKGETPNEELKRIKNEFQQAANLSEERQSEDDGFLTKKV